MSNRGLSVPSVASGDGDVELLLVMCPVWDVSAPPLGLAYLATQTTSQGLNVDVLDLNIDLYHKATGDSEIGAMWDMEARNSRHPDEIGRVIFNGLHGVIESWIENIAQLSPRFVGFSVHQYNVSFTEMFVARLRLCAPAVEIIYGGPEIQRALSSGHLHTLHADAYVVGEGEQTLTDTISVHRRSGRFTPVPGLALVEGGRVAHFMPRPPNPNLDELVYPTFGGFDLRAYTLPPGQHERHLPFLFSRGCIGECSFCGDHLMSGRYRVRSAGHAVAEIRYHVKENNVRHFGFSDLACNGNPLALERFCDRLIEENLGVMWFSYAIVLPSLSKGLFRKMRASGCSAINFGVESASDKVLKIMGKYYTSAVAEKVVRDCHSAGIQAGINIIVGHPGESRKDHQATLEFLRRNAQFITRVGNLGSLLLGGTSLMDRYPERYGIMRDDHGGSWYTTDGNTIEERNRRIEDALTLLQEFGLRPEVINREPVLSRD